VFILAPGCTNTRLEFQTLTNWIACWSTVGLHKAWAHKLQWSISYRKTDDGYQSQGFSCSILCGLTVCANCCCFTVRCIKLSKIHVLLSNSAHCQWVNIYANKQRIFKHTDMQVLYFFLDKICKLLTYHTPFYH